MQKLIYLGLVLLLISCNQEDDIPQPILQEDLGSYISNNPNFPLIRDSLIACALSGPIGNLTTNDAAVSILFYPEGNAEQFLYFESDSIESDPEDLSIYRRTSLTDVPLFNGYLRRFLQPTLDREKWCRVSYVKNGKLHVSNAIRIKANNLPTEYNSQLLSLDQSMNGAPLFSWEDGKVSDNAIYFQVILDQEGNLVSGTYTFEKQFQFYNLSNVVLNIRDVSPSPSLLPDEDYYFLMMGVSLDNWVNLIVDRSFKAN